VSTDDAPATVAGRPDVTLQEVGREAILHDARDGKAHVINGSAARVWKLCDGRSMDDLVAEFAASYERTPGSVRADVERIVATFRELGLLVEPVATA
jgi:hypothetical protein